MTMGYNRPTTEKALTRAGAQKLLIRIGWASSRAEANEQLEGAEGPTYLKAEQLASNRVQVSFIFDGDAIIQHLVGPSSGRATNIIDGLNAYCKIMGLKLKDLQTQE